MVQIAVLDQLLGHLRDARPSILDQATQEIYIPISKASGRSPEVEPFLTPKRPPGSKLGIAAPGISACEGADHETEHQGTLCGDGDGRPGRPRGGARPVSLAEIAKRQEISLSYLEQLFAKLRRGGLVKSVRGPGGGYRLSRPSAEVRIADIIMAVDEPITATRCRREAPRAAPAHGALRDPRSVGRAGPANSCVPVVGVAGRCGGAQVLGRAHELDGDEAGETAQSGNGGHAVAAE